MISNYGNTSAEIEEGVVVLGFRKTDQKDSFKSSLGSITQKVDSVVKDVRTKINPIEKTCPKEQTKDALAFRKITCVKI